MKEQKIMAQMKGQDKTTEKQLNEVKIGNLIEKEFRNDSDDDPGSQEINEDARNVYQRPTRTKEQTNGDEQYTRSN